MKRSLHIVIATVCVPQSPDYTFGGLQSLKTRTTPAGVREIDPR